jgi:hypothetical protein
LANCPDSELAEPSLNSRLSGRPTGRFGLQTQILSGSATGFHRDNQGSWRGCAQECSLGSNFNEWAEVLILTVRRHLFDSYRFVLIKLLFQSELSLASSEASSTTGADAVIAFLRLGSGTFGSVYVRNDVRFI